MSLFLKPTMTGMTDWKDFIFLEYLATVIMTKITVQRKLSVFVLTTKINRTTKLKRVDDVNGFGQVHQMNYYRSIEFIFPGPANIPVQVATAQGQGMLFLLSRFYYSRSSNTVNNLLFNNFQNSQ